MTEHTKHAPLQAPGKATEADHPPFLTPRRLIRWAAVVGVGILAVLACWQDPSYAQGGDRGGESEAMLRACGAAAVAGAAVATIRSGVGGRRNAPGERLRRRPG